MGRAARARRRPGRPQGVPTTSAWLGGQRHPGAGRRTRVGGRTGAGRPRRHPRCPRRIHRRRRVLRAERIPDHLAAARRTRPHRRDRPAGLLGPAGPTVAARVDRHGDGGRRAAAAVSVRGHRSGARRRRRRVLLGCQLGLRVSPHRLLHAGRRAVAVAAHLVARGGGAVLRRVAAGAGSRRRPARVAFQAQAQPAVSYARSGGSFSGSPQPERRPRRSRRAFWSPTHR